MGAKGNDTGVRFKSKVIKYQKVLSVQAPSILADPCLCNILLDGDKAVDKIICAELLSS